MFESCHQVFKCLACKRHLKFQTFNEELLSYLFEAINCSSERINDDFQITFRSTSSHKHNSQFQIFAHHCTPCSIFQFKSNHISSTAIKRTKTWLQNLEAMNYYSDCVSIKKMLAQSFPFRQLA